jgi:predicted O-methyltransferase YrrM
MKLVYITTGPILEMGCGMYSTPFLHWACFPDKRKLVTCENDPKYFDYLKQFEAGYHEINCVEDFDSINIDGPWAIAFIDHSPHERRSSDIKRLLQADYIVAHDTENREDKKYRYSSILRLFKYRYKHVETTPYTSVFSNKYDLKNFRV